MKSVNVAEGMHVHNENGLGKSADNTIKSSDENIQEQAFKTDDEAIGDRNAKKEERANGGAGLKEKISDTIKLANASKDCLYYLKKLNFIKPIFKLIKKFFLSLRNTSKEVLIETKEAGKDIELAQGELKDAGKVVEGAKKVVECVETKVQVWMGVHKELYDEVVDKDKTLRADIQQQIKQLEDNEKSRKETNDGLIKEFDGFIDQTKEEFKALVKDLDELDKLLKQFNECNEDDKQSHFGKIQEKQTALINKFNGLQEKQLKFLIEFRSKLSNACDVITQQHDDLIEELRKIAESNEDHDTIVQQAQKEYNAAQQKYEKIKKDHESWMPTIGWTRPTEQDVKNAEQEFLRKAAKLNILKCIDDNDIQNGLRSIIEDLDEIKQHQEHAIKDLNDARGHLDSVMKTVNKARKLTAIFSFDFDLHSTPVKTGLIGIARGLFIAVVAGCTAGPAVGIVVGCGLAGAALGKAIDVIYPDIEENDQIVGNESAYDDENDESVNEDESADDDDLDLLSYDAREDPIEEDVRDQSQEVQNVEEDKQDSYAKQTKTSEKSVDNVGVNHDIGNVVEFDDDDIDYLPQGMDMSMIDDAVIARANEIVNQHQIDNSESPNRSDAADENIGVLGVVGNVVTGVGKGVVNVVSNVGGAALNVGKNVIGGCANLVSKWIPWGKITKMNLVND